MYSEPTAPTDEILKLFLNWHSKKIRDILISYQNRTRSEIDILIALVEFHELDILDLYKVVRSKYSLSEIVDFIVLVLNNDPSIQTSNTISIDKIFSERPFPRYIVSLCYIVFIECLNSDIQSLSDKDIEKLNKGIYNHILVSELAFWPELLIALLEPICSKSELFNTAVFLLGDHRDHANFIGENILYGIEKSKAEITEELKLLIRIEKDEERLKKYKHYLKKYS